MRRHSCHTLTCHWCPQPAFLVLPWGKELEKGLPNLLTALQKSGTRLLLHKEGGNGGVCKQQVQGTLTARARGQMERPQFLDKDKPVQAKMQTSLKSTVLRLCKTQGSLGSSGKLGNESKWETFHYLEIKLFLPKHTMLYLYGLAFEVQCQERWWSLKPGISTDPNCRVKVSLFGCLPSL